MLARLKAFFAGVPGSVWGRVNLAELNRVVLMVLGSGWLVDLAIALLTAIEADASTIFSGGIAGKFAVQAIVFAIEYLRRKYHGDRPTPPPVVA